MKGELQVLREYTIHKKTLNSRSQKITFEVVIEDSSSVVNNQRGLDLQDLDIIDSASSEGSVSPDYENLNTPASPSIPKSPVSVNDVKLLSPSRKDFHCDACDKIFSDIACKRRHNRIVHEKVQRSYCALCYKSYIKRNLLFKHYRNQHLTCKGTLKKQCRICEQSFKDIDTLQIHFDSEHSLKPFYCKEHGKYFVHKKNLIDHLKKHKHNTTVESAQPAVQDSPHNLVQQKYTPPDIHNQVLKTGISFENDDYKCPIVWVGPGQYKLIRQTDYRHPSASTILVAGEKPC